VIPAREFIRPSGNKEMIPVVPDVIVKNRISDGSVDDPVIDIAKQLIANKHMKSEARRY